MSKINVKIILLFLTTSFTFQLNYSGINSKSKSSKIKLSTGTNLSIKNPISNYKGSIEKENNATITGSNINFDKGSIQDSGNKINITGALEQDGKIFLDGNKNLRSKKGKVLQRIEVKGQNNKIEGDILVENDIILLDETTSVTLAITNKLPVNIQINNGTIYLQEDLNFLEGKKLTGNTKTINEGTVVSQDRSIILNAEELEWDKDIYFKEETHLEFKANIKLAATWTFGGESKHIIDGNKNILYLEELGQIFVDKGSQLLIRNLTIKGLSETNIKCLYDNAKIIFQNVQIILSDDFQFQTGSFDIQESLEIYGPYKFAYQSGQASNIRGKSHLILDDNITFSYDPSIINKNLITFENETSSLILNNASLHATMTGMQLTKGNLLINNNANISSEKQTTINVIGNLEPGDEPPIVIITTIDEGITFGNNNIEEDLHCEILNGAFLNVTSGSLIYKNINNDSLKIHNNLSRIVIHPYAAIKLYQSLNLGDGNIKFHSHANYQKAANKKIDGTINTSGKIYHGTLE